MNNPALHTMRLLCPTTNEYVVYDETSLLLIANMLMALWSVTGEPQVIENVFTVVRNIEYDPDPRAWKPYLYNEDGEQMLLFGLATLAEHDDRLAYELRPE